MVSLSRRNGNDAKSPLKPRLPINDAMGRRFQTPQWKRHPMVSLSRRNGNCRKFAAKTTFAH